jgi:hypothetical protein
VVRGGSKPAHAYINPYWTDEKGRTRSVKDGQRFATEEWEWHSGENIIRVGAAWVLQGWPVEQLAVVV